MHFWAKFWLKFKFSDKLWHKMAFISCLTLILRSLKFAVTPQFLVRMKDRKGLLPFVTWRIMFKLQLPLNENTGICYLHREELGPNLMSSFFPLLPNIRRHGQYSLILSSFIVLPYFLFQFNQGLLFHSMLYLYGKRDFYYKPCG